MFKPIDNSDFRQALKYYFGESNQLPDGIGNSATPITVGRHDDIATVEAISSWDTSNVTDMSYAFKNYRTFNQDISKWNVSGVTDFSKMFNGAISFDQDISPWNTTKAVNMAQMFQSAVKFNQPIGRWNVSNVTNFSHMFFMAKSFNQDISSWNVNSGKHFQFMFAKANTFTHSIRKWSFSEDANLISMFVLASELQLLHTDVPEFGNTPQYLFFNYVEPVRPVLYGFDMAFQAQTVDQTSLALARRKLGRAHSALHRTSNRVTTAHDGSHQRANKLHSTTAKATLSISGERHVSSSSDRNHIIARLRRLRG